MELKQDFYMYPESTGIGFTTGRQLFILLTTDVVPSPTSLSCRSASSQRTLAAGCSTSSSLRMVAPSLVMVTSYRSIIKMSVLYIFLIHEKTLKNMWLTPMSSTNILSRPTGPRELLTMLAIDAAAMTAQITKKMKSQTNKHFTEQQMQYLMLVYSVILFSVVHSEVSHTLRPWQRFFSPISIAIHSFSGEWKVLKWDAAWYVHLWCTCPPCFPGYKVKT